MSNEIHEARREEHAAKVYNRRKYLVAKILGKETKMEKIAGKPMLGPWYFIYLKPNWVLKTLPCQEGQFIGHPDFWKTLVQSTIAPFYKIVDQNAINELINIPYAMPRGRMDEYTRRGAAQKTWAAACGNDFTYSATEQRQILAEFNLLAQFRAGMVRFYPDDHEIMLPHDHQMFLQIVGQLDAKNQKRIKLIDLDNDPRYMDDDD